jgi:DNA-binding CsgD family transcriptional regulator
MKDLRRLRRAIVALSRSGADLSALLEEAMRHIDAAAPADAWCGLTLDPATHLMTGGVHEHGMGSGAILRLLEIEHREEDVNLFPDLARARSPVGVLSRATGGEPERSARWRDVLRPNGYERELRVVLRSGGRAWGAMVLMRTSGGHDFDADEVRAVEAISEPLAEAIRASLLVGLVGADGAPSAPGNAFLLLGPRNALEWASAGAEPVLEELREFGPAAPGGLPQSVLALANVSRQRAAHEASGVLNARVRTRVGRWLTLRASLVGDAATGKVAVTVEPSRPMEVASLVLDAYGLSRREAELVRYVLHGFDTEQIAEALRISAYTVQDHLKKIFDKVGVYSRKELVARVFFTHYLPRMGAGLPVGPDGWFLPDDDGPSR